MSKSNKKLNKVSDYKAFIQGASREDICNEIVRLSSSLAARLQRPEVTRKGNRYTMSDGTSKWMREAIQEFQGRSPMQIISDGTKFEVTQLLGWLVYVLGVLDSGTLAATKGTISAEDKGTVKDIGKKRKNVLKKLDDNNS